MAKNNDITETLAEDRAFAAKTHERLLAGQMYKEERGLIEKWAEYQRFWEGDQWPAATEETEHYPRPVTNHFAEILEMKTAGLVYETPEIYYEQVLSNYHAKPLMVEPLDPEDKPFEITREELLAVMIKRIGERVDLEGLLESKTRSSGLTGNGILYHYFDNSVIGGGKNAGYIGDIGSMEIDITDFYPGNPTEPSIEKQPYIIVTEQRPLEEVKEEYAQFSEYAALLKSGVQEDRKNVYDHEKITYKEGNQIQLIHYWERKYVDEERKIGEQTVNIRKQQIDYYVIAQDYVIRKEEDAYYSKRYPFSGFIWYPIRKSFYGKSESDDLINNQKELNKLQGIALLGAYKMGLANILYKEGMVDKEDLPIGPGGGFIKDKSGPGQGWSVEYLQPPNIAPQIPLLKELMTTGMKDTSGVHEAWSGKAPSAHLNASAIKFLQEAAGVRINGIRRRLLQSVRMIGEIWLGYIMQYYKEARLYKIYGKDGVVGTVWFKREDFEDMEFDAKVTLTNYSPYSKSVIASTLMDMVTNQIIDGDLYLRMLPHEIFPKVNDLLELMEDRVTEQQQMMLQQQIAVVDEVVAQTIEQARASGVQITPEALQQMQQMIQSVAHEQQI